jgi:hypothetical protein
METIEKPAASPSTREARIREVLDEHRSLAHGALDDLMYEAFLEIGRILNTPEEAAGDNQAGSAPVPAMPVGGLSAFALRQIQHHAAAGDLADWLAGGADKDKCLYLRDFLNLGKLQAEELRLRYPKAFTKWTDDQDQALLANYREATEGGRSVNWRQFSEPFGRNVNAIKLRLERLGINLGAEAGHSRRPGGPAR